MKTIILLIILSTVCIAQVDRGTTLEQTLYTYEPSLRDVEILYPALEVRVCVDEAYGLVIVIDDEFFEKWRETKAKYYADIRIELPDTVIDLTYKEFVKRIKRK